MTDKKFTQKKIKISSQGLFFNHKQVEKKVQRIQETKPNFFRPFNSVFERNVHTLGKQRNNFNNHVGLTSTDFNMMGYKTLNGGQLKDESITISNIKTKTQAAHPNRLVGFGEFEAGEVISGKKALSKVQELQNNGAVKRIVNGYIRNDCVRSSAPPYKKKEFVPFVEERDHLGQLIDSDIRTELGGNSYVKKLLIQKPKKGQSKKLEIREDIPRRWLEGVGQSDDFAGHPGFSPSARNSLDGMINADLSSYYGNFSPMMYGQNPDSEKQSYVTQSWDKTKTNYKTLVAATKKMKLPDDKVEEVTNVDTQASDIGVKVSPQEGQRNNTAKPQMLKTLTQGTNQMPLQPAGGTRNRKLVTQNASKRQLQSANNVQRPVPNQTVYSEGDPLAIARYIQAQAAQQAPNDKNVTEILSQSNQMINLSYNHLNPHDHMKKLGLLSGTKHAIEAGITTQTEKLLDGGAKTNPGLRLNYKEEEYVLSQLIQRNHDARKGQAVFKSKTGRCDMTGRKGKASGPPVGLYEHRFNNSNLIEKQRSKTPEKSSVFGEFNQDADHVVDLRYINRPYTKKATTQAFSCFADTRSIDFQKGETRDEVSFYKQLARIEKAKMLGISVEEYAKYLQKQKTGKYIIRFNGSQQTVPKEKPKIRD